MTTAPVANFNGQKPMIDVSDTAMLLIDHQSGLFQVVKDIDVLQLRANVVALAKAATLLKLPVITSASVPQGPTGRSSPRFTKPRRTPSTSPVKARSTSGTPRTSSRRSRRRAKRPS